MNAENQALLHAIRGIVVEAVAPLSERIGALEERIGRVETRLDSLETRLDSLETRLDSLEIRLASVEGSIRRLEEMYETLDTRTNQMASDIAYFRDRILVFEERIDNGFRGLKSDISFAFSDMRRLTDTQKKSDKTLTELKQELSALQQRIATLEAAE